MHNNICNIVLVDSFENGNNYKVNISTYDNGFIDNMYLVILSGNETLYFPMKHIKYENNINYFETNIFLETKAIYKYYFFYTMNNKEYFIKDDNKFKLSVNFSVPSWAKGKVMYQIFVDRYKRGSTLELAFMKGRVIHNSWDENVITGPDKDGVWNNDFYGGDLKGIASTLDYIKSLGVSIIYLTPIMRSQSNHRYDTSDYENVDPYAGSNEDLKSLCDKAHEMGIKVILDAVFNHTGNDSKYFNEYNTFNELGAYQSIDSKYSSFYKKYYEGNECKFNYWWGMKNLPVCDSNSKTWQEYIVGNGGIIDKWFNLGIDGLRLDVADELSDDMLEKIRVAVKRNKEDGFIIGEVWENPMRMNRSYIESGKSMDTVMNYSFIDALIRYFKYDDVNKLSSIIDNINKEYPKDTINSLMNFTSTHDISRAINIFSSNEFNEYSKWAWDLKNNNLDYLRNFSLSKEKIEYGKKIYKLYIFSLIFMPGTFSIFYGDEVCQEGLGNLENRKPFNLNIKDKEMLEYFRYVCNIRNKEKFLEEADLNILEINKKLLMFERSLLKEKMLVAINKSDEELSLDIPEDYKSSSKVYKLEKSSNSTLYPYSALAIKNNG